MDSSRSFELKYLPEISGGSPLFSMICAWLRCFLNPAPGAPPLSPASGDTVGNTDREYPLTPNPRHFSPASRRGPRRVSRPYRLHLAMGGARFPWFGPGLSAQTRRSAYALRIALARSIVMPQVS